MNNKGIIQRIVGWFMQTSNGTRLVVGAALSAIPFYFAAFLSNWIAEIAKAGGYKLLGIHAFVIVVLLIIVGSFWRYVNIMRDRLESEDHQRMVLRLQSYTNLDRLVTSDMKRIMSSSIDDPVSFIPCNVASIETLQEIIHAAYYAFEGTYGQAARTQDRIDFEVTFMTRSYLDDKITIPAWGNREGRAPRSMILRDERPDIYENTVTANIYREDRPSIHIIEDTIDPRSGYATLYDGQLHRIRSSIVFPVVSDTNVLLGTMVVHCDRADFFQICDEKYWTDLLEVFAKRLALVKIKLDRIVSAIGCHADGKLTVSLPAKPF